VRKEWEALARHARCVRKNKRATREKRRKEGKKMEGQRLLFPGKGGKKYRNAKAISRIFREKRGKIRMGLNAGGTGKEGRCSRDLL